MHSTCNPAPNFALKGILSDDASNGTRSHANRSRLIAVRSLFSMMAFPPVALAASEIWVEAWRHETSRPLLGIAVGDLTGDGEVEVVALSQEAVTVYALDAEGPRFLSVIEGIPERPTAVGVYPYQADGPLDVWVGTQNPGIVYVYRYDPASRSFERLERIRYAWADIERVIPFDLDGWGYADLAVVTNQRELVVFSLDAGRL